VLNLDALMGPQSPLKGSMASYDVTVKLVAALEYTQPHFIRELHAKAARGESLAPVDVVRISRDDPRHKLFGVGGPSLAVETFLYQHVQEAQEENYYTSTTSLMAAVKAATDEDIPRSTLKRWLRALSIRYGKKKLTGLKHPYAQTLANTLLRTRSCCGVRRSARLSLCGWMRATSTQATVRPKDGSLIVKG